MKSFILFKALILAVLLASFPALAQVDSVEITLVESSGRISTQLAPAQDIFATDDGGPAFALMKDSAFIDLGVIDDLGGTDFSLAFSFKFAYLESGILLESNLFSLTFFCPSCTGGWITLNKHMGISEIEDINVEQEFEADRWYRMLLVVKGASVEGYLDGELIFVQEALDSLKRKLMPGEFTLGRAKGVKNFDYGLDDKNFYGVLADIEVYASALSLEAFLEQSPSTRGGMSAGSPEDEAQTAAENAEDPAEENAESEAQVFAHFWDGTQCLRFEQQAEGTSIAGVKIGLDSQTTVDAFFCEQGALNQQGEVFAVDDPVEPQAAVEEPTESSEPKSGICGSLTASPNEQMAVALSALLLLGLLVVRRGR